MTSSVVSANWPIKEFKVIHRAPGNTSLPDAQADLEDFEGWDASEKTAAQAGLQGWSRLIERYLNDIANRFDAEGFEPPQLPVVVDGNDGRKRKYAVYLFDFGEVLDTHSNFATMFHPGCQNTLSPWLGIAREKFGFAQQQASSGSGDAESIEARAWDTPARDLWKTLAHEVFHAIQGGYDSRYHSLYMCEPGDVPPSLKVIAEGTADAAAYFLAAKKWPELYAQRKSPKVFGGNRYDENFFSSPTAYFTSSFWRFIAEEQNGLQYLEHLFRQPVKQGPNREDRIEWVDKAFRKKGGDSSPVGESLYTLFPRGVAEIFSYSTRYDIDENKWTTVLTSEKGCKRSHSGVSEPVPLPLADMPPISAQCVDIQWPAFQQPVEIKIEAITFSKEVADQLHMGISRLIQGGAKQYCWEWSASGDGQAGKDTCLEEKLKVQTGPSEGKFAKIWIMDSEMFKKAGFARLIISNVAPPPTSKFPDAPGPQATTAAENVVLRYGFARVEAADEYPPPTQISPMGPATLMGELKPYKIDLAGPVLLASTSPMSYMMQSSQQGQVDTRELLYGIKPGAPLDIDELPDLSSFQIGEAGEKHYTITPVKDLGLGYTGPLKASVGRGLPNQSTFVSSDICLAGTLDSMEDMPPVGSIEKSSELQLEIRISTDLCELDPMRRQEPPMPVVDHFEATLILPLGWRYYSSTAPADVMTPGTQVYMDRYHQQMMSVPGIENIMNSYLGGSDGTSGGSGGRAVSQAGCDCSCEGLKTVRAQNRNKAGMTTEQKMTQATCAMQCVQQWKACPTQASVSSQGPVDQNQAGVVTDDGTPQYPATAEGEIEAILDTMVGKSAPDSVRNSIRSTVEEMSPDERAQILHAQNQPGSEVQHASGPYSQTGAVSIPVNPDWDAETLRYKAAVEQLGLLPDITEDAVEMFFSNEQPMRERLWQNIREQLARKQQ